MSDRLLLRLLKTIMLIGIGLILLGVYFHNFSHTVEQMGVNGIILSAVCVAVGMILSLPTKMYLTFVWVKREDELHKLNLIKDKSGESCAMEDSTRIKDSHPAR